MKLLAAILLIALSPAKELDQLYKQYSRGIDEAYEGASHKLEIHPFEGGIEGLSPIYGRLVLPEAVTFRWRGKNILGKKPVFVFLSDHEQKVFSIRSGDKKIKLSAGALGLKAGRQYRWYLGKADGGPLIAQSRVFRFTTLSKKESQNLARELSDLKKISVQTKEGLLFLTAEVYYRHEMYQDMVALLKPIYKKYPTLGVKKLLYLGYVRLGRHHEAKKYRD